MAAARAENRRNAALHRLADTAALPRPDWTIVETELETRDRWRRRTAVTLLWLAVVYPLSAGPTAYVLERGWLPPWAWAPYEPLATALRWSPPLGSLFDGYVGDCRHVGRLQSGL